MITQGRQQVEAQAKAFAPVAVRLTQDTKHLETVQCMFDHDALAGQLPVVGLLFSSQRMMLALLVRRLAVLVPAIQAAISRIRQAAAFGAQSQATAFEEREVMRVPSTKGRRQNPSALLLHHDLCFQGVPLLLTAKESFAFFWAPLPAGCSIWHSVASTTTTCQSISLGRNAFLPGKVNRPERIKAFSTRRTVREAVASLRPYVLAI